MCDEFYQWRQALFSLSKHYSLSFSIDVKISFNNGVRIPSSEYQDSFRTLRFLMACAVDELPLGLGGTHIERLSFKGDNFTSLNLTCAVEEQPLCYGTIFKPNVLSTIDLSFVSELRQQRYFEMDTMFFVTRPQFDILNEV